MKRTTGHDCGEVTGAIERPGSGFIRTIGRRTRAGIFPYLQPDGSIRRELRRPEEVFKADSLATLRLVPLTLGHHGLIDSSNVGALGVGSVGNTFTVVAPYVETPLTVQRKDAVQEFSCTPSRRR